MGSNNKSYRIRTTVGREADSFLDVHLDQDYDSLEILSLKISDKDVYKLHNSDYGVVVGRVLANGNFGVPNAKISVFIPADEQNSDMKMWNLYPYTSTSTRNNDNIRYNLLPDKSVKDCHKAVGTFPNKTFLLENDSLLEVFDNYYLYTTRTNAAGDYLICGVPTGMQTIHMDLDLSDCGILSQRPRDFVYKGYTIEQFENPNQFKKDENLDSLSQIFSQNQPVYVNPFWGNADNGDEIGITRADIEISFKFEPTCVFMGSAISDNASNGVGKKCVPTNQMGAMDELTAGEGTIEMIRKTPAGNVEEFAIKGNQLINGNGVWCYQIPMNLDYMMTDEYGNMVPTDDPEKGIPTRTRVRFRASLTDMENSSQSFYRAKYLIPNNPDIDSETIDYDFGTYTDEESYRDLFWNGVYTVKSYIPRFQKSKNWRNERFSGIKACNYYGGNNPMPYNNMRIKLPFMFTVLCIFVKLFMKVVTLINRLESGLVAFVILLLGLLFAPLRLLDPFNVFGLQDALNNLISDIGNRAVNSIKLHCTFIGDGLCPDLEGWYFAPGCGSGIPPEYPSVVSGLLNNTLNAALGHGDSPGGSASDSMNSTEYTDEASTDVQNTTSAEENSACLTVNVDYLLNCFEMNLAQEYRVIKFDFYNDWVNGVLYFPRWMRKVKRKKKYKFSLKRGEKFITSYYKDKVQGCMNAENSTVKKTRYYTQQCSIAYASDIANSPWTDVKTPISCYGKYKTDSSKIKIFPSRCHKSSGMQQFSIFGKKSGLVTERTSMLGQNVYYLKPCEWKENGTGSKVRTLLFATDIILLGTLNDCDENGLPQSFKYLNNSSYIMPTNLALTTMDDDAYIYTSSEGTVCSSTNKNSRKNIEGTVLRTTPGYESTYSAYSKTDSDVITYGENDDPIPVTEAAGISWNYSGPGQDVVDANKPETPIDFIKRLFSDGDKRYHYLYYPGGHFLGLSCTNSETNIKSCVNLKRICEMGATMSQRREELRGYDQNSGEPKYRYYVPTGLISNVDIEGAAFRSMFATMNHNKLIATVTNDVTGYKKYDFRFLRPDGFDGALANYVHKANSPYNRSADPNHPIEDASNFFRETFGNWSKPDDYDPEEVEYTEARTVEDGINDYYMFRFGLNTFDDKEQKKHYLLHYNGAHSMPQYENSFYFYFGLKDGATALDEFKKQFFSECETNNVTNAPNIIIKEEISDEDLSGKATLVIDNMLPTYTVTIKNNTNPSDNKDSFMTSDESIDIGYHLNSGRVIIGSEYTVSVTDSLEQTEERTFVFGATSVNIEAISVPFRKKANSERTEDDDWDKKARDGGFIKINNEMAILKKVYQIDNPDPDKNISLIIKDSNDSEVEKITSESTNYYTDASGEKWYVAFVPKTGTYKVFVEYNENEIPIFTSIFEDNSDINFYIGCDYLSYKQGTDGKPSAELKDIKESDWFNRAPFDGTTWKNWLMRHTFYRQTDDDNAAFDSYIYTSGKNELAVFGQPERGGLTSEGEVSPAGTLYSGDYDRYEGYSNDPNYSYIPSMYWNPTMKDDYGGYDFRNTFDVMAYSEDGRAAANALNAKITGYTYDANDGRITLNFVYTTTISGEKPLKSGRGCLVVLENGLILFPVVTSTNGNTGKMKAYYANDIYPSDKVTPEQLSKLLSMASIYPTMPVPVIYKAFYGKVTAVTWNEHQSERATNKFGETIVVYKNLPLSYSCGGAVYNGLTFDNHFFDGFEPEDEGEDFKYDTYFIDNTNSSFYDSLTANTSGDKDKKRTLNFHMQQQYNDTNSEDYSQFSYGIKENFPDREDIPENVYTGRYEGGFDQTYLTDGVSLSDAFYNDIKIRIYNKNDELDGITTLYTTEALKDNVTLYVTKHVMFDTINSYIAVPTENFRSQTYEEYYYKATYNKNADYDIGGTPAFFVAHGKADGKVDSTLVLTNAEGVRKPKDITDLSDVRDIYNYGVTLAYGYSYKDEYKNIDRVLSAIRDTGNTYEIEISRSNKTGTVFGPSGQPVDLSKIGDYNAIIAVYKRPESGSKSEFTLIHVYAIEGLDTIYPTSPDGIDAYLRPIEPKDPYGAAGGTFSIRVLTNTGYKVTCDKDWVAVPTGQISSQSILFTIGRNTTQSTRTAKITFETAHEVYVPGSKRPKKLKQTVTITQNPPLGS